MKKHFNSLATLCLLLFLQFYATAQSESRSDIQTIEFRVTGNCAMCKKTIENSLKDMPGVTFSQWNKDTKVMTVSCDLSKIKDEQIHEKIANAGYDTEKKKASDKAYRALPECCQYERTLHTK